MNRKEIIELHEINVKMNEMGAFFKRLGRESRDAFMGWWKAVNAALTDAGQQEIGWGQARDYWGRHWPVELTVNHVALMRREKIDEPIDNEPLA